VEDKYNSALKAIAESHDYTVEDYLMIEQHT
jgi:hypothetical protein